MSLLIAVNPSSRKPEIAKPEARERHWPRRHKAEDVHRGNMQLTIFIVLAAISCSFADDDHGKTAPLYTKDNFNEEVAKKPHFVMFFAPW